MNIRKPVDYSALFTELEVLLTKGLPQLELYCQIGRLISGRPEKGVAIAAAEYLQGTYPDASGFSPRNLRRMRAFYCAYKNEPDSMAAAMQIGWTQNVVILEAGLTAQENLWYLQAVRRFGWSKGKLLRQIASAAHFIYPSTCRMRCAIMRKTPPWRRIPAMPKPKITSAMELEMLVQQMGFLPFFSCSIPSFSIEEFTPSRYWFVDGVDGPWEWRMELARRGVVAYGKLFSKKAGLVSREWYPDLANCRRDGYDFDARYEEGLASYREKRVMDVLFREGPTLSKDLKRLAGFGGDGLKGFDTVITNLQMQTYITVHSFEYARDKHGQPYGWGIAKYAVTEDVLGADVSRGAYHRDPEESKARIIRHLGLLYPDAFDKELAKFIR